MLLYVDNLSCCAFWCHLSCFFLFRPLRTREILLAKNPHRWLRERKGARSYGVRCEIIDFHNY